MIKRRFYRYEHGDNDAASGESSSSDSDVEPAETSDESENEEQQEDNAVAEVKEDGDNSSSGYESDDSSANEVNLDSSGSEDELGTQNVEERIVESLPISKGKPILAKKQNIPEKDVTQFEASDYVLKWKSVFKCRICPRIVCLSEETINTHLKSKRHARSEKLLREGRLKLMLNEKGQIEGDMLSDGDSDSEKASDPEDSDSEKELAKPKRKKNRGRLKQKKRLKQEKALKKAAGKTAGSSAMNRKERRKNMQPK